jgi:Cft2 family RNA processing exonuclease
LKKGDGVRKAKAYVDIRDLGGPYVGATSILLELYEEERLLYRILLDAGLRSEYDYDRMRSTLWTTPLKEIKRCLLDRVEGYENGIQSILVSHVHEDHAGALPWIYSFCKRKGLRPPIFYMSDLSKDQFDVFQQLLYEIFQEPAKNAGEEWMWEKGEVGEIPIKSCGFNTVTSLDDAPEGYEINFRFRPSGHIVGAAMIELIFNYRSEHLGSILYTGDFCVRQGSFLVDGLDIREVREQPYSALIFENTYLGGWSSVKERRREIKKRLAEKISKVLGGGGNVVLLVYGVDRTANVLVALREILEDTKLKSLIPANTKVYLDTRLGGAITDIYEDALKRFVRYIESGFAREYFRSDLIKRYDINGLGMMEDGNRETVYEGVLPSRREEIIRRHEDGGLAIVVATSATLQGGTVFMGYLQRWGMSPDNLFLIMGSAIPHTPAYYATKGSPIRIPEWDEDWRIRKDDAGNPVFQALRMNTPDTARLEEFSEISAHATYDELQQLVKNVDAKYYIGTHVGGVKDYKTIRFALEKLVYGHRLRNPGKVFFTDLENKIRVELKPHYRYLLIEPNQWARLCEIARRFGYSGRLDYRLIRRVINRLINEFYTRKRKQEKTGRSL